MNRIILSLLLFMLTAATAVSAQEMRVISMKQSPMDLTAARNQRKDLNDVPCALVKVQMPDGAVFEGNVMGPVEFRTGEHWVYMPRNSKELVVKHPLAKPLHVKFAQQGLEPLQSNVTYVLNIGMPSGTGQVVMQNVQIDYSPAEAIVLVDGQIIPTSGGTATTTLAADRDYRYTVTAVGYIAQEGTFHLHPAVPTYLNLRLSADPSARKAAQGKQPAYQQPAPAQAVAPQPAAQTPLIDVSTMSADDILTRADREYDNENYATALQLYLHASERPAVQNRLGNMYEFGEGVERDYAEAVKWYRRAAEQGYALGQYCLGDMYDNGKGVTQNYAEAMKWYRKAAEAGSADAQCDLGLMYELGRGVPENNSEAVAWYRRAADQDYARGQYCLADMYENGKGVAKNYVEAFNLYRRAAEQDNAPAQVSLGIMYEFGKGVTQSYSDAVKWYRAAAEQGRAAGQYNLGDMYENGKGVTQDYAEAMRWYRKAADQGHVASQRCVGRMYDGGKGVAQNYTEAMRWYRKAADEGDASSQVNVGILYEYGRGVAQDYTQAAAWYRKAADQGYARGQAFLGECYYTGHGVSKNTREAYRLLKLAADQDDDYAVKYLNDHSF